MPYRVDWWLGRSASPEYQRAYDAIAGHISTRDSDILVEIGCGPGEMIRRVKRGSVVGTDITLRMLQIAQRNMRSHDIEPLVYTSSTGARLPQSGVTGSVTLVLDDYLSSNLPSSYADQVLLTFPEADNTSYLKFLSRNTGIKDMQAFRRNVFTSSKPEFVQLRQAYNRSLPYMETLKLKSLQEVTVLRDKQAHRILKDFGQYVVVDYEGIDEPENYPAMCKRVLELNELDKYFELTKAVFVADPLISADATSYSKEVEEKYSLKGYGITVYRKI